MKSAVGVQTWASAPGPVATPDGSDDEAPYEMANLRPEKTGLPFVVFVSQQGGARHGPWIELSPLPRYDPAEAVAVTLEDPPRVVGDVPVGGQQLRLVSSWIELNRATLEAYWSGEIEFTDDMIGRIRRLP